MNPELSKIFREISNGNESAWQALLKLFNDKLLSTQDLEQLHIYIRQLEKKNPHGIYIHALLYDFGIGVKQDFELAFLYMREAAGKGHSAAIYEIGKRFFLGIGIEKNYHNAFQWLIAAAESPHYRPEAMLYLGMMYEQGLGAEKDPEKANQWFDKAASKGYRKATD